MMKTCIFIIVLSLAVQLDISPKSFRLMSCGAPIRAENPVAAVSGADTPAELRERNIKRFSGQSDRVLDEIECESNDSVAVRAAWERVLRTFPPERKEEATEVNSREAARFLGFLKGRLRIPIPGWWAMALAHIKAYDARAIFGDDPNTLQYRATDAGYTSPTDTHIRRAGQRILVRTSSGDIEVPSAALDPDENTLIDSISVAYDEKQCYLALHSRVASPYRLVCVGRATHDVRWRSNVWASGGLVARSGPGFHRVSVHCEAERIFVCGYSDEGAYMESFCAASGDNLFRFSTSY